MNFKKIALSLTASSLLFGSAFSTSAQTSDDKSRAYLVPIIDLLLNSEVSCSAPEALTVLNATDDGGHRDQNIPLNTIDGLDGFNGTEATRWSHNNGVDVPGTEAIITFELESTAAVSDLSISWLNNNQRSSFFSIETSLNGITWTPVLTDGATILDEDAINGEYQSHDVEDTSANYVRLIGNGNTQNGNEFTSINEVIINGCIGLIPSSSSSSSSSTSSSSSGTGSSSSSSGSTSSSTSSSSSSSTSSSSSSSTTSSSSTSTGGVVEVEPDPDFGLDPNSPPWENFDLSDWALDGPNADPEDGLSARTDDRDFIAGNLFPGTEPFFFTGADGGMVFKSVVDGARTSSNTNFARSELREMLRAGNGDVSTQGVNENNWVLGYQPENLDFGAHTTNAQDETPTTVGGQNGRLTATLRVNQVTTTGRSARVGRVIIGQIHADDDEPLRLYYRKLPTNEKGSIYFVHEIRGGDDLEDFELVGLSDNPPNNHPHTGAPIHNTEDGIALGELFSYEIVNEGSIIRVIIRRGDSDGEIIGEQSLDMNTTELREDDGEGDLISVGSFYDIADEWMYFKAGAYSQNNTEVSTDRTDGRGAATTGFGADTDGDGIGDEADFDLVTFYRIANDHTDIISNTETDAEPSGETIPETPSEPDTETNTDFGLNPSLQPWDNFDLSVWGLDSPALRDISADSSNSNFERGVRVDDIDFIALNDGDNNSNFDDAESAFFGSSNVESSAPYFFTGEDGGMVFVSPVNGGRTSTGTRFPRSELREYARGGVSRRENGESVSTSGSNENNWVLGYQPNNLILEDNGRAETIENVGGRNGVLKATLSVNKVTETGRSDDVGVTIIGQIHAEDDEPLRLYYRKLPGFDLGSVYAVHEIRRSRGDETPIRFGRDTPDRNLVGTSRDLDRLEDDGLSTEQINTLLADGIALDEIFSYEIINDGELITVNLIRGDADQPIIATTTYNMATIVNQRSEAENDPIGSGYDRADESMYFKAGLYTQNNSAIEDGEAGAATTGFGPDGTDADYDQATFYRLSISHDENDCSECTIIE